eukprot:CAMPEP_0206207634 /NCGR_PEP_ID=MMETSP0166-20121206/15709_1 /ASSEMBLY_ACC=CAM_ASM_000260 /TAXON_ID=95228 /ORGANISM="Vannella robusta, Strain DIVA3 518/3/11/1/6" /LENGTH=147 /DNA_ID=CAMNT_0053628435 /DNA_START=92 /DNA_END=532 /DNA_ORIENTATION=-
MRENLTVKLLTLFINKKKKKEATPVLTLTVPQQKNSKSPFASPQAPRRAPKGLRSNEKRMSSPAFTRVKKQTPTLRVSANSTFKIPSGNIPAPKRLLEQEKRGSFLLQKETPAEYVHIRSAYKTYHASSEVVSRKGSRSIDLGIDDN